MRVATWTGALLLGMAAFAACAGGGDEADRASEPKDTAVVVSCQPIGEIQSYRYTISLKLESPAFQGPSGATPNDPLGAFAEALTALFADMEIEGAYVAPDRSQTILQFQGEEVELRVIGNRSWVRLGAIWQ